MLKNVSDRSFAAGVLVGACLFTVSVALVQILPLHIHKVSWGIVLGLILNGALAMWLLETAKD